MRNLITAAALLAAGTALANAAVVTDVLTTTFTGATTTTVSDASAVNDPSDAATTTIVSLTTTGDTGVTTTGAVVATTAYITPDTNVGNGGTWTLTLSYAIGSDSLTISGVTLDTILYNASGVVQGTDVTRYFDLTLTITDSNNSVVATYAVENAALSGSGYAATTVAVDLTGSEVTLAANTTYTVTLTAEAGSSNTSGCYIGLAGITYTIPEPSAFGMLAGVGALALVAARRRRTRKAA